MRLSDTPVRPIDHLPQMGAQDNLAIDGRAGAMTYAELECEVGRLAAWLSGFGFEEGSRVATWCAKGRVAVIMPLACVRSQLVHVPINPMLKRAQVAHILADSGARLLIGSGPRLATLTQEDVPPFCMARSEIDVAAAMTGGCGLPPSDGSPDQLAAILYTSGSTGKPKGVMLSNANLWLGAFSVADYLKLGQQDRVLAVLPLSFDYGQNQLFSTWAAGGCVIPLDYLTPRDVVKAVERDKITSLAGVPPLWVQLIEAQWPEEAAGSLRRLTNSGGALSRGLVAQMRKVFPQADIYPMYGLTEAFRSTYLRPDLVDSFPESMGSAIPHAEILVCHSDGSLTKDGEAGELVHCGPLVAQGYWNDAGRTAERFKPAPPSSHYGGSAVWSGDTVRREADGLLYFVGRTDAMIKTAGNRISPGEIEEVALAVPGVVEAVAVGVPDHRLGQAVMLYLRAGSISDRAISDKDDIADKVREAIKRDLPTFMTPQDIIVLDIMPKNPNGKIDRAALTQGNIT